MENLEEDTLSRELSLSCTLPTPRRPLSSLGKQDDMSTRENRNKAISSKDLPTIGSSASLSSLTRPRAPVSSTFQGQNEEQTRKGEESQTLRRASRNKFRKDHQPTRKQKSKSITELWASLNRFSRNNMSRSLLEQDNTSTSDTPSENIHFVNINDDELTELTSPPTMLFINKREPVESLRGSIYMANSTAFTIPELPRGKVLTFNLLSSWGDPHYIGLLGIEVFDKSGHLITLENPEAQLWAQPADINVLPEYGMIILLYTTTIYYIYILHVYTTTIYYIYILQLYTTTTYISIHYIDLTKLHVVFTYYHYILLLYSIFTIADINILSDYGMTHSF